MKRRDFINTSAIGAGIVIIAGINSCTTSDDDKRTDERGINKSIKDSASPISTEEIKGRIQKAQRLMREQEIKALLLDSGTSMQYFTGLSWGASERPMIVVIPADGDISYVCPGFEEERLREIMRVGDKTYIWQEDESPYLQAARAIKDAGIYSGKIGIEERLRFFIYNGIKKETKNLEFVGGESITIPCRIIKSATEITLMQKANDITSIAILKALEGLKEGMKPSDFIATLVLAHKKLGIEHSGGMANFAEASAFPHGSTKPQLLKKGDIVLVDCGCTVEGYHSDISRTIVFGSQPSKRQKEIWVLEKKAQAAGFEAAQLGMPLENVDIAARKVLTDAGFGPGYKLPGLPHRTGHGIGMDGHEWGNAVKGNKRIIEPGMCFSIEPNISIVGEFGVRLEDCVYMTTEGPKWFSQPSPSITRPFVFESNSL